MTVDEGRLARIVREALEEAKVHGHRGGTGTSQSGSGQATQAAAIQVAHTTTGPGTPAEPIQGASEEVVVERIPRIGYRAWFCPMEFPVLKSLAHEVVWQPGKTMQAQCLSRNVHRTAAEIAACKCGLYHRLDLWDMVQYTRGVGLPSNQFIVFGAVAVSGIVIPAANGLRGQYADILGLWVPDNLNLGSALILGRKALADVYAVPVYDTWQELVASAEEWRAEYALAAAAEEIDGSLHEAVDGGDNNANP